VIRGLFRSFQKGLSAEAGSFDLVACQGGVRADRVAGKRLVALDNVLE
jgi:hypothetical protein